MGLENPLHLAILLTVILLVFGAKRLPEMGRSLGDGMRGFKEAISGSGSSSIQAAAVLAPEAAELDTQAPAAVRSPQ